MSPAEPVTDVDMSPAEQLVPSALGQFAMGVTLESAKRLANPHLYSTGPSSFHEMRTLICGEETCVETTYEDFMEIDDEIKNDLESPAPQVIEDVFQMEPDMSEEEMQFMYENSIGPIEAMQPVLPGAHAIRPFEAMPAAAAPSAAPMFMHDVIKGPYAKLEMCPPRAGNDIILAKDISKDGAKQFYVCGSYAHAVNLIANTPAADRCFYEWFMANDRVRLVFDLESREFLIYNDPLIQEQLVTEIIERHRDVCEQLGMDTSKTHWYVLRSFYKDKFSCHLICSDFFDSWELQCAYVKTYFDDLFLLKKMSLRK
jgi:hypothetical protein